MPTRVQLRTVVQVRLTQSVLKAQVFQRFMQLRIGFRHVASP